MLALRIIATVFVGISIFTTWAKNTNIWSSSDDNSMSVVATIYGWLWRAFVIVALWVI